MSVRLIPVEKDNVIIKAGECNDTMVKLVSGKVGVYKAYKTDEEILVETVLPGKCAGEVSFLANEESPYSVVAMEDSLLMQICREGIDDFIRHNPNNVKEILENISKKLLEV